MCIRDRLNDSAEVLAEASAGLQILNDRLADNGCTLDVYKRQPR